MENNEKILNLAIGVPSLDMVHTDFMMSVIGISMDIKSRPVGKYSEGSKVSIINKRSSVIAQLREDIVDEAKRIGANWLLFVDSDQLFPTHTARQLICHDKDIVACNIAVKRIPSLPTARKYEPKYPRVGDIIYTKPSSRGLEEVWRIGFGITLIRMSVFDKISRPYFRFDWNSETGSVGEDWTFFEQVQREGIKAYIDHDLSKQVGHLGVYSHTMNDVDHTETELKIIRPDEQK
jgi:hypothetical protein